MPHPATPLARAVDRYTALHPASPAGDGSFYETAVAGLCFVRYRAPRPPEHVLYGASLCVVVQGSKTAVVGETVLTYGPGDCLVLALDLPLVAHITEATPAVPYLALLVALDAALLVEVAGQAGVRAAAPASPALGAFVGPLPEAAADALLRLVRLLETPAAIPALAEPVLRELYYWLLTGPDGPALARATLPGTAARRVAGAIRQMKDAFPGPVRVEALAAAAGMSASAFHAHFKAATALAPLQYYKRLRLLEARRLLAAGAETARDVAFRVGYESPSQFSREYARTFGAPPARDAAALAA